MKRTEPISLGEALDKFFSGRKLYQGNIEGRALELWCEVVGEYVAEATEDVYIRNGIIFVHFKSPSVRSDVMTRKLYIVSEINRRLGGGKAIRNIVLR